MPHASTCPLDPQQLLERTEELRHALMRHEAASRARGLLLAHISEGLLMVDCEGRVSPECSAATEAWFGAPVAGALLWDYLGLQGTEAAELRVQWAVLTADVLPLELALDQLPRRLRRDGRTLQIEYRPVYMEGGGEGELQRVVLVLRDVTGEIERRRLEDEQREMLEATDRMVHNRDGFREFFLEADEQVARLLAGEAGVLPEGLSETKRLLHTLKGNVGLYGLRTIAGTCHEIETRMAESGAGLSAVDREELGRRWRGLRERLRPLIRQARGERIVITMEEHEALLQAVAQGAPREQVLGMLRALRLQAVQVKLEHLAVQARELCLRLGKAAEVSVQADGLRIPGERFGGFFSSLVHVLRNAVDHGLEEAAERVAVGKGEAPRIWLRTRLEEGWFVVEIEDDGRGVDWERVREKALSLGLPAGRREDLVQALFADGISTREVATELSGRGVGLAAVRGACEALGGTVEVRSAMLRGTCFRFRFPGASIALDGYTESHRA